MHCWMVLGPCIPTDFPPAAAFAFSTALSMPSVTKWTVEFGRGQPAGMLWVKTKAGPQEWFPPHPPATSKVRRPVMTAPNSDVRLRMCPALGSDTLNVIDPGPPVRTWTFPELKYQSKTSDTPSFGSATKPSSDIDMIAMTFDIKSTLVALWHRHAGLEQRFQVAQNPRIAAACKPLIGRRLARKIFVDDCHPGHVARHGFQFPRH